MAITLVVETGAANPLANSYIDVAGADAYWAARGGNATWDELIAEEKKARLIVAFDYIRGNPKYRWRGTKVSAAQRGPYPRTGASERDGAAIASNEIPWQLPEAQCLLAPNITEVKAMLPELDRGGMLTSESLSGVYSASYEKGAPAGKTLQYLDGLLAPLLRSSRELMRPSYGVAKLPDVFLSEHYSGDTDDATTTEES